MRVSFIFNQHQLLIKEIEMECQTQKRIIHRLDSRIQDVVNQLFRVYMHMYEVLRRKYSVPAHIQILIRSTTEPNERNLFLLKQAMLDIVNRE